MQEHLAYLAWELADLIDLLESGRLSDAQLLAVQQLARVQRMRSVFYPPTESRIVVAVGDQCFDTKSPN